MYVSLLPFTGQSGEFFVPVALLAVATLAGLYLPGPVEAERFKTYFAQGEALFKQGDYGAAIWNFRKADALKTTPEVAFDLAKCHEKIGDVPFATYYYRAYLKRAPGASDAIDVAEKVGKALADFEASGKGLLEVDAALAVNLVVAGKKFPFGPVAMALPPGNYEITATFGKTQRKMSADVRIGKASAFDFEPLPVPLVSAATAGGSPGLVVDAAVMKKSGPGWSAAHIASIPVAGVGVAALAVGIIMGVLSAGDASQATTNKTLTYAQAQAFADSANSRAAIANSLMIGGGAAIAGGVVMFVLSFPTEAPISGGPSR